jgi:hypothetical protein
MLATNSDFVVLIAAKAIKASSGLDKATLQCIQESNHQRKRGSLRSSVFIARRQRAICDE